MFFFYYSSILFLAYWSKALDYSAFFLSSSFFLTDISLFFYSFLTAYFFEGYRTFVMGIFCLDWLILCISKFLSISAKFSTIWIGSFLLLPPKALIGSSLLSGLFLMAEGGDFSNEAYSSLVLTDCRYSESTWTIYFLIFKDFLEISFLLVSFFDYLLFIMRGSSWMDSLRTSGIELEALISYFFIEIYRFILVGFFYFSCCSILLS